MVGAVAGVAAVIAAGSFAFAQIRDNDTAGGASSPKELGQQLTSALDDEDILGAVDLLLPGERDTFRQPLLDVVEQLKRLEVTSDSADLSKVAGLDITITDPTVRVATTNVDDISLVSVRASSSVTVDGKDLPLGTFLIDTVFDGDRPELDQDSGEQDFDVTFASVKRDGRWYISMFYSAANALRGDRDIPEEGIEAAGASTPEGALDSLVTSAGNLDIEGLVAGLNPHEAEALQRFAPLFIDDAQSALDAIDVTWKISDTAYSVSGTGDTRQVAVTGFHVEVDTDGETVEFDLKDGCVVGSTSNGEFDSCSALDQGSTSIDDALSSVGLYGNPDAQQLIEDSRAAFQDFALHGVVVDKVDGKWYVSPIGSSFESILSLLRALDRDEIETLINDVRAVAVSAINIDVPTIDTAPDPTYPTPDSVPESTTVVNTIPLDTTVAPSTVPDDSIVTDASDPSTGSWYDCLYQFTTSAEAATCIQTGIAAGTYDATTVPGPFLFPECGLFDYYNGTTIYTDDAATFLATIQPGTACIVAAAAAKGIDITYSSPEFVHPECYAMDNPFNYDEPGEVDGFDCVLKAS